MTNTPDCIFQAQEILLATGFKIDVSEDVIFSNSLMTS